LIIGSADDVRLAERILRDGVPVEADTPG